MGNEFINFHSKDKHIRIELEVDEKTHTTEEKRIDCVPIASPLQKEELKAVLTSNTCEYELYSTNFRCRFKNIQTEDYPEKTRARRSNFRDFMFRMFGENLYIYWIKDRNLVYCIFYAENGTFSDEKIALEHQVPEPDSMDDEQMDALIHTISPYVRVWNPHKEWKELFPTFVGGNLSFNDFPIAYARNYNNQWGYIFAASNGIDEVQFTTQEKKQTIFEIESIGMDYSDRINLRVSGNCVRINYGLKRQKYQYYRPGQFKLITGVDRGTAITKFWTTRESVAVANRNGHQPFPTKSD